FTLSGGCNRWPPPRGHTMSDLAQRLIQYDDLVRRFASGVRAAQLYAPDHPLVGKNIESLIATLKALHQQQPTITVGIVGSDLVVADTPLPKASASLGELIRRLKEHEIERISFDRGVTSDEIGGFVQQVASL